MTVAWSTRDHAEVIHEASAARDALVAELFAPAWRRRLEGGGAATCSPCWRPPRRGARGDRSHKRHALVIRRVGMAPRLAGVTPERFQEHWRTAHAEAAGGIPGLRGYVQNHAVLEGGAPLLPYPGFDACSELSFDSVAAMDEGFASEHYQTTVRADEGRFIVKERFSWAITRPEVLLDRGAPADPVKLMTFWRAHPVRGVAALLAAAEGWAAAVAVDPAVLRHERLVVLADAHAGRDAAACDLIDVLYVDGLAAARSHLAGLPATEAAWRMAGAAFGMAHLVARPRVVVQSYDTPR